MTPLDPTEEAAEPAVEEKPWHKWRNFNVWHGKLPHWRADDVTYFVTFRHRRNLEEGERMILFREILKLDARRWTVLAMTVLPDRTELLAEAVVGTNGTAYELNEVAEKAKTIAGRRIIKISEERFPPFYSESYDRIVRDEDERATFLDGIVDGSLETGLVEQPEDWPTLYVADAA